MKLSVREMTAVALFTALTAICAQIAIPLPFSPVPITLSIFPIFLSALLLGTKCAVMSQLTYVLLGVCGVPVFQGFTGGFGVVAGPKGGYIVSYVFMALAMGYLADKRRTPSIKSDLLLMLMGLLICYFMGTIWLAYTAGLDLAAALGAGVIPFLPLDIVKIGVCSVLSRQLRLALTRAKLLPVS